MHKTNPSLLTTMIPNLIRRAALAFIFAGSLVACQASEPGSAGAGASSQSSSTPGAKEIASCEKNLKAFLASDYTGDNAVPVRFLTKAFARLWLQACNPPEGETNYWGADPILETQDDDPALVRFGPGLAQSGKIEVPVVYQHRGQEPFTKTFVFTDTDGKWLIADIVTSGNVYQTGSEFAHLSRDFGNKGD
jgi:hypothetical protein